MFENKFLSVFLLLLKHLKHVFIKEETLKVHTAACVSFLNAALKYKTFMILVNQFNMVNY
jgi:hypothetical protein